MRLQAARPGSGAAGHERAVDNIDVEVDVEQGAGLGQPVQLTTDHRADPVAPCLRGGHEGDAFLLAPRPVGARVAEVADPDLHDVVTGEAVRQETADGGAVGLAVVKVAYVVVGVQGEQPGLGQVGQQGAHRRPREGVVAPEQHDELAGHRGQAVVHRGQGGTSLQGRDVQVAVIGHGQRLEVHAQAGMESGEPAQCSADRRRCCVGSAGRDRRTGQRNADEREAPTTRAAAARQPVGRARPMRVLAHRTSSPSRTTWRIRSTPGR